MGLYDFFGWAELVLKQLWINVFRSDTSLRTTTDVLHELFFPDPSSNGARDADGRHRLSLALIATTDASHPVAAAEGRLGVHGDHRRLGQRPNEILVSRFKFCFCSTVWLHVLDGFDPYH